MGKIRVLLVDDQPLFQEIAASKLNRNPDIEIVATVSTVESLVAHLQHSVVHVVLMDTFMPEVNGFDATREIQTRFPHVSILIHTLEVTPTLIARSFDAGASGYVSKYCETSELEKALFQVAQKGIYYGPDLISVYTNYVETTFEYIIHDPVVFSQQDLRIICWLFDGFTPAEIATFTESSQFLSPQKLVQKYQANSIVNLLQMAIKSGCLDAYCQEV